MQLGTRRVARIVSVVVAIAAFAVPLAAGTPANAGSATVTATPNDKLVAGQKISVSGTGFTDSEKLALIECTASAPTPSTAAADCNESGTVTTQADGSGNITDVKFTVSAGAVGKGGDFCPSKTAAGPCYLVVADLSTFSAVTSTPLTVAPVISATPHANVKSGQKLTVSGYGFPAEVQTAYVVECASPPSGTTCDAGSVKEPKTSADGTFRGVQLTVVTGTWGGKSCKVGGSCLVTATTDPSGTQPDTSGRTVFTFAKSQKVVDLKTEVFASGKVAHHKVTLSGAIEAKGAGVSGLELTVYERAKGTKKWHKVKIKKSGKSGTFGVKGLKHFAHKEQYRITHKSQKIGTTVYKASTSKTITVK